MGILWQSAHNHFHTFSYKPYFFVGLTRFELFGYSNFASSVKMADLLQHAPKTSVDRA